MKAAIAVEEKRWRAESAAATKLEGKLRAAEEEQEKKLVSSKKVNEFH